MPKDPKLDGSHYSRIEVFQPDTDSYLLVYSILTVRMVKAGNMLRCRLVEVHSCKFGTVCKLDKALPRWQATYTTTIPHAACIDIPICIPPVPYSDPFVQCSSSTQVDAMNRCTQPQRITTLASAWTSGSLRSRRNVGIYPMDRWYVHTVPKTKRRKNPVLPVQNFRTFEKKKKRERTPSRVKINSACKRFSPT